jgi:hypothetical protein
MISGYDAINYAGEFTMKSFAASTEINAAPEKVWKILTDASKYPEWDPYMVRLEGKIAPGEAITAHTKLSDRAFPVKVSLFMPNQKMVWSGGLPLKFLFWGDRTFLLEPLPGSSKTRFSMKEEFSGLLLPIFGRTLPDLNPIFADFAAALKKRAESA